MRRAAGVAARAVSIGAECGVTPALGCTALSPSATGRGGVASSRAASSRAPTSKKGRAKAAKQAEEASGVAGEAAEEGVARSEWDRKVVSACEGRGVSLTGRPLWRLIAGASVRAQRAGEPLDMEGAMVELMRPGDPGQIPVYERYGRKTPWLGFEDRECRGCAAPGLTRRAARGGRRSDRYDWNIIQFCLALLPPFAAYQLGMWARRDERRLSLEVRDLCWMCAPSLMWITPVCTIVNAAGHSMARHSMAWRSV